MSVGGGRREGEGLGFADGVGVKYSQQSLWAGRVNGPPNLGSPAHCKEMFYFKKNDANAFNS
jgi:hypothetical protein